MICYTRELNGRICNRRLERYVLRVFHSIRGQVNRLFVLMPFHRVGFCRIILLLNLYTQLRFLWRVSTFSCSWTTSHFRWQKGANKWSNAWIGSIYESWDSALKMFVFLSNVPGRLLMLWMRWPPWTLQYANWKLAKINRLRLDQMSNYTW
jgi:hypothetical protein